MIWRDRRMHTLRMELATLDDLPYITAIDQHVHRDLLIAKINNNEIYIVQTKEDQHVGVLRYNYFWDNTPFMNLLWLDAPYRGKGFGSKAVLLWEQEMVRRSFRLVMTSTLANEEAQHFYRKLGYKDAGCLLLEGEPLEIILTKSIGQA